MSTPIIFVGTAPTPTTGVDTASHGPHDAASIDQNMANLRSVLDNKMDIDNTAWTSFTPTITSNSGTITTKSATGYYKQIGKTVFVDIQITITTNGTGAGFIKSTLPVSAVAGTAFAGRERQSTGKALCANVDSSGVLFVVLYDGTYPGGDGYTLAISGVYQAS